MTRRVLITGARAPVALHMARLLHGAGYTVHLADSMVHPLASATRCKAAYHRHPPLRFQRAQAASMLTGLILDQGIELVIPTCEEVLHLGRIWQDWQMPAPLFAPAFPALEEAHDKHRFILLCQRLGLQVPETRLLRSSADVSAMAPQAADCVFKPVWSRFATQTVIRPDATRLAAIRPTEAQPWVAQRFIPGQELCVYAVAQEGRVLALAAYRGLMRAGLGASICFAPVQDAGAAEFVRRFIKGTGWTGQVSFDLIRQNDGLILPIECNPRATSGLHFFRDPAPFARMLEGGTAEPDVTRLQGVRLAMRIYGFSSGQAAHSRKMLATTQDVMDWPEDRIGIWGQLRPLAGIAAVALRRKIGLQAASTHDIEWNADHSSMS